MTCKRHVNDSMAAVAVMTCKRYVNDSMAAVAGDCVLFDIKWLYTSLAQDDSGGADCTLVIVSMIPSRQRASVQKGFVKDVTMEDVAARKERLNKVDIMKSTLFPRQAVRIFQNPNSSTRSNNRIPNLGMESVRDKSILRNKEGLNDDGHAASYSYSHAGKSSIPTSFGESTFVSTINPSSDKPIDVEEEAWLSKATGGVDGPTGAQSGMF
nr:hypothetical protein [Tanacetum cinerariifolium]